MTKAALAKAGGLEPLVEYLADDYEMGERDREGGLSGGVVRRGGGDDGACLQISRVPRSSAAVGAVDAGLAQAGVYGAGDYVLRCPGR